ncbi:tail fiber domain-containing protein [Enterobacter chuandaensis]|uniref:Tail fiber domain-containing protein n=1 Tax=Enterobacter chuandaensis TaxID=2497875 RepID=A0AA96M2I1_9ENTR|nr:tail fiber domain-containing protein [Enterobacter chuandaensis]MCW4780891.1 tail fiber domain-containing protein [Enterobacter chuandaensis]MDA4758739.1 tail fiber domain-containing protein [Enterobacter chuandaensis]WNS36161.1 tail fiber domain-containing protein [Enterobacter chuandaensis]
MSAGTITLTNGSAIVGGTGTSFTAELSAGDFIVSTVGGVSYTLPVKSVESNTQLTLVSNFTGPTQSGAAWSAVPRVALNMVTAALVAQSAEALRGLNYDKQNWQLVYSAAGNITVKLPDGTTFTGPSWKYLSDNMATKSGGAVPVNQGGTGSTTESGARTNLGLGNSATRNVGTEAGTVAAGDDSRLNTLNGKSGGQVTSGVSMAFTGSTYSYPVNFEVIAGQEAVQVRGSIANFVDSSSRVILNLESVSQRRAVLYASGGIICQPGLTGGPQLYSTFLNYANGPVDLWVDTSRIGAIQVAATSDKLLKKEIEYLSDRVGAEPSASALKEVLQWNPATFKYKKRGIIPESDTNLGFIANDLVEVSPECVKGKGLEEGYDENNTADAYSLDEIAMIAKLTLSIQELQKQISLLKANGAGS